MELGWNNESMAFERSDKNQKWRPQNGQLIRELREMSGLRQNEFVEKINAALKNLIPGLPISETLTQTMVSDIERNKADLRVLHLFAFSNFFKVSPAELLVEPLPRMQQSAVRLVAKKSFADAIQGQRQCKDATKQFLCPTELFSDSFLVCSQFPYGIFTSEECFSCYDKPGLHDAIHLEFYPMEAFINFLFSPVSRLGRNAKISVLGRILKFFGESVHRQIYFMSPHGNEHTIDPCMYILPKQGNVAFLFGNGGNDLRLIEVKDRELTDTLYKYYRQMQVVRDGLRLVAIARDVLQQGETHSIRDEAREFYQRCLLKTDYADWVKACFDPDVQAYLVGE